MAASGSSPPTKARPVSSGSRAVQRESVRGPRRSSQRIRASVVVWSFSTADHVLAVGAEADQKRFAPPHAVHPGVTVRRQGQGEQGQRAAADEAGAAPTAPAADRLQRLRQSVGGRDRGEHQGRCEQAFGAEARQRRPDDGRRRQHQPADDRQTEQAGRRRRPAECSRTTPTRAAGARKQASVRSAGSPHSGAAHTAVNVWAVSAGTSRFINGVRIHQ